MSAGSRPPIWLVTGPEELLLRRAADRIIEQLGDATDLDLADVRATELRDAGFPDLRTPSLFGAPRALLIRDAQDLPGEVSTWLLSELERLPWATTALLLATGTARIGKLARRIGELGGRVEAAPPREWEDRKWQQLVADEFRRLGRSADAAALRAILDHAGLNVATIAEKVAQAASAAPSGRVSAEHVAAVVVGRGSRGSFAVADAMCQRRPAEALTLLRGALESGADPVMVLGALAYRLRSLVAVAAGVEARSIGLNVSTGQARRLQSVRRNFGPGELTRAYQTLADADREIKGGELPPALVLERAVVAIAERS